MLSKFGKPYFRLLIFIVCSSIFVIAGLIELIPVIGKLNFLSKLNLECLYSISEAIKYCTKMGSPKDENVWLTVLVMLFQIVVFEGLIIAAIVGWTARLVCFFRLWLLQFCYLTVLLLSSVFRY